MKNYYTITTLIFFAALSFKKMNMAKITPNLYMDKYEVTNSDWKAFEKHLINEGENPADYRSNEVWDAGHFKPFRDTYFQHKAYDAYPVLGVTHEGAKKYCTWKGTQSKTEGTFRLPTIEELQYQMTEGEQGKKWEKCEKWSQKMEANTHNFKGHDGHITAPSASYCINKFGVHNIKGNVAEMTTTEGKALGGSYADSKDIDWENHIQSYDAPTNWLGFRCVCELTN